MNKKIEQLELVLNNLEDTFLRVQVSNIPIYQVRATLCVARGLQLIAESLQDNKVTWRDWKPKNNSEDPRPGILADKS